MGEQFTDVLLLHQPFKDIQVPAFWASRCQPANEAAVALLYQWNLYAVAGEKLGLPRLSKDNRTICFTIGRTEGDIWMATLK